MELKYRLTSDNIGCDPIVSTEKSVGIDFFASEDAIIEPMAIEKIKLGVVVKPPEGCYLQLMGRSSICGHGLIPLAGTIDPDYCGEKDELSFMCLNASRVPIKVKKGTKICQGVLLKYAACSIEKSPVPFRAENRGGFGSTGK